MTVKFTNKDRVWLWFSLGAVSSFVGIALIRTAMAITLNKGNKLKVDNTQSFGESPKYFFRNQLVDDSGEAPCRDNGSTLVSQLRSTDWNLNTSNTLKELDLSHITQLQIKKMAGELWFVLKKNILSLEIACERWVNDNAVVHMLRSILLVYKDAIEPLEHLAAHILDINPAKQGLSGTAQSWPNCICFLANNGSCVEIVAALALSFPIEQQEWARLRDELKKSQYHWNRNQFELFDKLAKPIKNFDEIAIKALNNGLRFKDTSVSRIENSAKVLQDSVELFWKFIVVREGERDSEQLTGFDLKMLLTPKAQIHSSLLSDIEFSSDPETRRGKSVLTNKSRISSVRKIMRHNSEGELKHPARKKYHRQNREFTRIRSNTAPQEKNLDRFSLMTSAEQKTELNEMRCLMQNLVGVFNEIVEESSSPDENSSSYDAPNHNFRNKNSESSELAEMAAMNRQLTHLRGIERSYSQQEMKDSSEISTLESNDSQEQLLLAAI